MNNIFYKNFVFLLIFSSQTFVLRAPDFRDHDAIRRLIEEEGSARHALIMDEIPARGGVVIGRIKERPSINSSGFEARPVLPNRTAPTPPRARPQSAVGHQQPPRPSRPAPAPPVLMVQPAVEPVRTTNDKSPLKQCLAVVWECERRVARLTGELSSIYATLANPQQFSDDQLLSLISAKSRIEDLELPKAKEELEIAQLSQKILIDEEMTEFLNREAVQRHLLNQLEEREAQPIKSRKAFIATQALEHEEMFRRKKIEAEQNLAAQGLEEKNLASGRLMPSAIERLWVIGLIRV